MTIKQFWVDPYLTELKTLVQQVQGDWVQVYETIFYALSGGQESDAGTFNQYSVLQAKKSGSDILYQLPENHDLKIGDAVYIKINWDRRYKLMRLHFAAEIILELVYKKFPTIVKIGAHISEEKARVDFNWPQSLAAEIPFLKGKLKKIIDLNLPIISAYADKENEKRYWEIKDFSKVPCGGTHLKNTKEIGGVELKRINLGKNKERIEIKIQNY